MTREYTYTEDQIGEVAADLAGQLSHKTLCLYGEMGAGKTTLIKALVRELGGGDEVNSPTFGLVNEYLFRDGGPMGYHFDFYRMEDETEALDIGLLDYLHRGLWVFMEWPEKIPSFLPENRTDLHITVLDPLTRKLRIGS